MRAFTEMTEAFSLVMLQSTAVKQDSPIGSCLLCYAQASHLQAIGIGTISRRWISTTALNDEYAERKRQKEKMLEDEQVISAEP